MDADAKTIHGLNVEPGAVVAKRYQICERIGAGGVGMVFRAIDHELDDAVVALKLLLPHLAQDENVFRRFRNEVLVARTLSHPNIVRTHDMGRVEAGYSYISMEFVDGVSLKDKVGTQVNDKGEPSSTRALPFAEGLAILYQIISGVAYAHGKGVIHRDLKPANVLLSRQGEVKLADFGTARIIGMDTSLTQTGQIIGTPDYMSPEQIRGELLDHSCDIYSLGILAYELVVGQRPFPADSAVAVAFKHLNDPVPAFALAHGIPEWFEVLVRRATAKKKEDRFPSALDFAQELLEYAPELSAQSTFFGRNVSARNSTGGTGRSSATATTPGAPATGGAHPGNPPAQGTSPRSRTGGEREDRGFQLGKVAPGDDSGSWRLDYVGERETSAAVTKLPDNAKVKRSSPVLIVAGVAGTALALFMIVPRLSSGVGDSLGASLAGLHESSPGMASFLATLSGSTIVLPKTATPGPVAVTHGPTTVTPSVPAGARGDAVPVVAPVSHDEAVPRKDDGVSAHPVAVAPISSGEPAGEKPPVDKNDGQKGSVTPPEVLDKGVVARNDDRGTVSPNSKTPGGSVGTQVVKETVTPPQPPALPPLEPFSAAVELKEGSRSSNGPFSVDRLGSIRWIADVHGLGGKDRGLTNEKVRAEFAANVIELRQSRVIAKLKADQVELPPKGDAPAKVSGALGGLRNSSPQAGTYRFDLLRGGEVVASKEFSLYRATVEPVAGTIPGTISIVRGSAVTGEPPKQETGVATPSAPADAGIRPATQPSNPENALVLPRPGINDTPTAGIERPATVGGLPIAKGHSVNLPGPTAPSTPPEVMLPQQPAGTFGTRPGSGVTESTLVQPGSVERAPADVAPQVPPPVAGVVENQSYRGTLNLTEEDSRPLTLTLGFSGPTISGTAEIGGYGQFQVSGRVLGRGIELELRNETTYFASAAAPATAP